MDNRNSDRELGRAIWERGIRLGRNVSGKTSYELEALGRKLRTELDRAGISPEQFAEYAEGAAMQVDAAGRGAADVFSFGSAAEISAGMDALLGRGGSGDFTSRYEANLQREEARDAYDREHRKIARFAGEAGATAALYRGTLGGVSKELDKLPPIKKGPIGERLSELKSARMGDPPVAAQVRIKLSRGVTIADHRTGSGQVVEAKFGARNRLKPRQIQAKEELGPLYRVDWWLPRDVAQSVATSLAGLGLATSNRGAGR